MTSTDLENTAQRPAGAAKTGGELSYRKILATWWPLAASWLMMGFELPVVSAVIARLAHPEVNLAAYGGVVFPLALVVEAPIIMLLAASVALSRDEASYRKLRRFMFGAAGILTAIHLLIAATPLYDLVVGGLIGAPEAIRAPARIGLLIMTPWTASIAYRRFHQGVLIRFNRPRVVGVGTAVRLGSNFTVLTLGYLIGGLPGIVVGTGAVAVGVMSEAAFIGWSVRPIVRGPLHEAPAVAVPITLRSFASFYVPLAMTPLLTLLALPILSAALSRLPRAIDSLAVWPVMNGLTFALRSLGVAMNEVVVALLDEPRSERRLFRFSLMLAGTVTLVLLLVAATPLGRFWFSTLSGLSAPLSRLARSALWLAVLLPAWSVFHSWYQGVLVHARRTRPITEAVAVYLAVNAVMLLGAARFVPVTGIYVGLAAMVTGGGLQALWLRARSGGAIATLRRR